MKIHPTFLSMLSMNNYSQLIKTATRITNESATLIDVIFTTLLIAASVLISLSHHDLIGYTVYPENSSPGLLNKKNPRKFWEKIKSIIPGINNKKFFSFQLKQKKPISDKRQINFFILCICSFLLKNIAYEAARPIS